jgi:hypothetical protein
MGAEMFQIWSDKQGPVSTQHSTICAPLKPGKTASQYFQEGVAMEAGREDE